MEKAVGIGGVLKIAVDFDGTLADSMSVICDLLSFKHERKFVVEDVDSWEYWDLLGPEYKKSFWEIYDDLFDKKYYRRAIPPVHPFSCPTVKVLERAGHEVEIVTSNDTNRSQKSIENWLFGHGLDTPVKCIGRHQDKSKLEYDWFIDDNPHLAEKITAEWFDEAKNGRDKRLILIDQPWNRSLKTDWPVVRMSYWPRMQTLLEKLELM